jgi:enediyne biosynthesis protein E4
VNNSFSEDILSGYYDAGIGICALGGRDGTCEILSPGQSGFCVRTDGQTISEIKIEAKKKWIVTSNKVPLLIFGGDQQADKNRPSELLSLSPSPGKNQ